MKNIQILFLFLTFISSYCSLFASEKAVDQIRIAKLVNSGYIVTLGELTGAGSKIPLSKVQGFIGRDEIIHKNEIENIVVKSTSANPAVVADVKKIILSHQEITSQDIVGFFIAK